MTKPDCDCWKVQLGVCYYKKACYIEWQLDWEFCPYCGEKAEVVK